LRILAAGPAPPTTVLLFRPSARNPNNSSQLPRFAAGRGRCRPWVAAEPRKNLPSAAPLLAHPVVLGLDPAMASRRSRPARTNAFETGAQACMPADCGHMRSAANAAETCIHLTTQLVRGRLRDALRADLRARTGLAASSAPRATAETPYPRNGLTMGQVVPCPLRCVPNRAVRNRGHVVVPEALRVAARTSGPAVDRRRHPSQCLIGRGHRPRT
jgi:hypothetical protein